MAEPLCTAVVGCGAIARTYVDALRRVPALRLGAAVDPDHAARAALVAGHDVAVFDDTEALLGAGLDLDAALLLVPPARHEAIATALLGAGVHVLCEKPLAPTFAAAERMLAAARAADRVLLLGSKFRYTADAVAARELLQAQRLGAIVTGEVVFGSRVDMRSRWNGSLLLAGGGVLMDNGSHAADLVRCLLGPIVRVQAAFAPRLQALEVEDTATMQFATGGGALVQVLLSWSVQPEVPHYLRLCGADGALELGWRQSRWKRHDGAWQVLGQGYDKQAAFAAQLTDFAAACHGATPRLSAADALATVQVVTTAYRAAAEQRWLAVGAPA